MRKRLRCLKKKKTPDQAETFSPSLARFPPCQLPPLSHHPRAVRPRRSPPSLHPPSSIRIPGPSSLDPHPPCGRGSAIRAWLRPGLSSPPSLAAGRSFGGLEWSRGGRQCRSHRRASASPASAARGGAPISASCPAPPTSPPTSSAAPPPTPAAGQAPPFLVMLLVPAGEGSVS